MTNNLTTLSFDQLTSVCGGLDRNTYVQGGGALAEHGAQAGAIASNLAGPEVSIPVGLAAYAGQASGATRRVGEAVGGAVWDAGTAIGEGAYRAYSGVKGLFGG